MRQMNFPRLAVLGLLLSLLPQAWAQEPVKAAKAEKMIPVVYHFEIMEVSDQTWAKLQKAPGPSKAKVEGKLLQSVDLMSVTGVECLTMLGHKNPIIYYDPRALQFQIQFVDIGFKLDVVARSAGPDAFSVTSRHEFSAAHAVRTEGDGVQKTSYPQTSVFIAEAKVPSLNYGDTVVLGRASGPSAVRQLSQLGRPTTSKNLVATLRLERP